MGSIGWSILRTTLGAFPLIPVSLTFQLALQLVALPGASAPPDFVVSAAQRAHRFATT